MEIDYPMDVFEVDKFCIECGKGKMIRYGGELMTYPPQYKHKCNKCDFGDIYKCSYPYIKHVRVKREVI